MDNKQIKGKKKLQQNKGKKQKKKTTKQKQKQNVRQYVKVDVQSQGGSGGGGSSSSLPQTFRDRSGENVVLMNLIEQLGKQFKQPQAQPQPQTIIQRIPPPIIPYENTYNPSNDLETINSVFNAPNNNDMSIGERLNEVIQPQTELTNEPNFEEGVDNVPMIEVYNKSVSKMGKDELINKYYDLINNLNITDNLTPLEIGSLTVPKIRDAVNQLVEKQKNKNKNDELIEKLNYKLLIQQEKLKAVPMANVSERIKKTKIDQHNKNIVNLQQQITELLKK